MKPMSVASAKAKPIRNTDLVTKPVFVSLLYYWHPRARRESLRWSYPDQVTELTGTRPERCYVDRGYRGHGVTDTAVFFSGQRRNVTPTIKKELKRRSAIEAVIGHKKTEERLGWNRLRGVLGDKVNALMAAIGYNLRLILKAISFLVQFLTELFADLTDSHCQIKNN